MGIIREIVSQVWGCRGGSASEVQVGLILIQKGNKWVWLWQVGQSPATKICNDLNVLLYYFTGAKLHKLAVMVQSHTYHAVMVDPEMYGFRQKKRMEEACLFWIPHTAPHPPHPTPPLPPPIPHQSHLPWYKFTEFSLCHFRNVTASSGKGQRIAAQHFTLFFAGVHFES